MRPALLVPVLLLPACASDHGVTGLCSTPQLGFDIEEASVLQDAQAYPGMHDAVILEFDDSELPEGAAWRVKSVEIMAMIGASEFGSFADGQSVSVEVWDADDPYAAPWVATQTFDKDALEWDSVTLTNPESAWELNQRFSWWRFDFTDEIPVEGLTGPEYLVGVVWDFNAEPALGYSNFNRSCSLNWTDYADGFGWVLNSDNGSGAQCSWPMLRVHLEVLEEADECDGERIDIQ